LYEGAGNQAREDYAAESVVQEGFEVALFGTWWVVSMPIRSYAVVCVCVLPTPTAGLTLTSKVASSGISSLRSTSMGPLTAPMMEKPLCVYVAEPSARLRCVKVTSGTTMVKVYSMFEVG
jgi:hypothetical protein